MDGEAKEARRELSAPPGPGGGQGAAWSIGRDRGPVSRTPVYQSPRIFHQTDPRPTQMTRLMNETYSPKDHNVPRLK